MSAAAATHLSHATLLLVVSLGACAGAPPAYDPGRPDPDLKKQLVEAERLYRSEAPEYPAARDALASSPVGVAWLVRLFVRDLILTREGVPLGQEEELMRAAARIADPVAERAQAEIDVLGARAVPTLVGDLLRNSQPQPRELGIELLQRLGPVAVPALLEAAKEGELSARRGAARALGASFARPEVAELLRSLLQDGDFTLRADAVLGLADGGDAALPLLLDKLEHDADPFVRRSAVKALAQHPEPAVAAALVGRLERDADTTVQRAAAEVLGRHADRTVANALVAYLERCEKGGDAVGWRKAQLALQQLAGVRGRRTPADWRVWAANWHPEAAKAPAAQRP